MGLVVSQGYSVGELKILSDLARSECFSTATHSQQAVAVDRYSGNDVLLLEQANLVHRVSSGAQEHLFLTGLGRDRVSFLVERHVISLAE